MKREGPTSCVCLFSWLASDNDEDWSPWAEWTECSVTCGSGTQQRGRSCDVTSNTCLGPSIQTRACSLGKCDTRSECAPAVLQGRLDGSPRGCANNSYLLVSGGCGLREGFCQARSFLLGGGGVLLPALRGGNRDWLGRQTRGWPNPGPQPETLTTLCFYVSPAERRLESLVTLVFLLCDLWSWQCHPHTSLQLSGTPNGWQELQGQWPGDQGLPGCAMPK